MKFLYLFIDSRINYIYFFNMISLSHLNMKYIFLINNLLKILTRSDLPFST